MAGLCLNHAYDFGLVRPPAPWPRLLFTSSRDGVTEADVEAALRPLFGPDKVLVAGGARGGDQTAARLWRQWGGQVDERTVSPDAWQRSRGAGYARNAEMVAEVKARGGECLAVIARCVNPECARTEPHGTHGAVHCAGLAEAAGLPVTRARAGAPPEGATQTPQPDRPAEHAAPAAKRGAARYCRPGAELPAGICPGCRTSALASGRERCQACGALEALAAAPQRSAAYPALSHGQPGHMCVMPGPEGDILGGYEAEAG